MDLTGWTNMDDSPPRVGQKIRYWFKHTGISVGIYDGEDKDYGWHNVSGKDGFLGENGMYWQPLTDEEFKAANAKIRSLGDILRGWRK